MLWIFLTWSVIDGFVYPNLLDTPADEDGRQLLTLSCCVGT